MRFKTLLIVLFATVASYSHHHRELSWSEIMKRLWFLVLIIALFAGCNKSNSSSEKSFTIAVIPQGSTHEFWKSIHAGALKASQDYAAQKIDVKIIWKGPMREDDREQQVQVVEGFLAQNVNGIVLAPFDKDALVRPVEEAKRANIPHRRGRFRAEL
jgi:ribose transport system substrate-binding protein